MQVVQDGYHVLVAEIMVTKLQDKTRIKVHNDPTLSMKNEACIRVKEAIRIIQLNIYSNT